jgi:hypothetical protein
MRFIVFSALIIAIIGITSSFFSLDMEFIKDIIKQVPNW